MMFHVPTSVSHEVFYMLQPDEDDEAKLVKVQVDLTPLIQAGILHICKVEGEQEAELFVKLATRIDDGEAACFAIAHNRGWLMATDDRSATKLAAQAGLPVISTPGLVKSWAESTEAASSDVAVVLQNIQRFAQIVPRTKSPEYVWWMDMIAKASD
jgi:predicted nucleic acid-binding protein